MMKKITGAVVLILVIALAYLAGQKWADGQLIAKQATIIEQMTTADERMLRSKTNFARPGVTQEDVDRIKRVAYDYGVNPELLYAGRRTENGGRGLYYGANMIDADIRQQYKDDPLCWQPAMFAKTWNKHLNRLAQKDLMVRNIVITNLARQWNVDPEKWALTLALHLAEAQGAKGLEVTEPPRKNPTPTKGPARGTNPKANRGGHKTPKTSQKETVR